MFTASELRELGLSFEWQLRESSSRWFSSQEDSLGNSVSYRVDTFQFVEKDNWYSIFFGGYIVLYLLRFCYFQENLSLKRISSQKIRLSFSAFWFFGFFHSAVKKLQLTKCKRSVRSDSNRKSPAYKLVCCLLKRIYREGNAFDCVGLSLGR